MHASIRADGYVPKTVRWFRHELEAGIEEYAARLDRGVLLAGQVRDGAGQPVAGATLTVGSQSTDFTRRENSAESSALTNLRGEWACDVPPQAQAFRIEVEHPDFALLRTNVSASQLTFAGPMLVLNPGVAVAGSVTTGTGEPVPEAVVTDDDRITGHDRRLSTVTDSNGQFFFPHVQPGKLRLRARSQDARDGFYDLEVSEDTDGVPILVGEPAQPHAAHLQSVGEQILRLAGRVTDALTGLPIPKFEVRLGEQVVAASPPGSSYTLRDDWALLGEGRAGVFEWDCEVSVPALQAFRLEICVPGYRPKRSASTAVGTERAHFDFPLEKERTISGRLLTPTGDAATGAIVLLSGKDLQSFIRLNAGQPLGLEIYAPSERETRTTSDSDGLFAITAGAEVDQVIVLHESGCRIAPIEAFGRGALILEPWGRIEGSLTIGGQAGGGQTVGIKRMDQSSQPAGIPLSSINLRTDEAGRFTIPRVPAGIYRVFRVITPARPMPKRIGMSHHVQAEVRPGETSQVALGGNGRRITGRVRTVPQDAVVDWTNDLQNLARVQPAAAVSNSAGFQNAEALANATFESRECYYLAIAPDGSFEIDDVPPGNYQLSIRLTRPLEPTNFQPSPPDPEIGSLTQPVVVPDAREDGDLTVNLGTVTVQVAPR